MEEHRQLIALINQHKWQHVVLAGGDFLKIQHPFTSFENAMQAKEWFQQQRFTNATILIKGSRSMQMEKVLEE